MTIGETRKRKPEIRLKILTEQKDPIMKLNIVYFPDFEPNRGLSANSCHIHLYSCNFPPEMIFY